MGLDTVELVMEVEEHFGISIPDRDAEHIESVGDLHTFVLSRLEPTRHAAGVCATAAAFYAVRRHAAKQWPRFERQAFRPGTHIEDVVPRDEREAAWRTFDATFNRRLPPLIHRWPVRLAIALSSLLAFGSVLAVLFSGIIATTLDLPLVPTALGFAVTFAASVIAATVLIPRLAEPWRDAIPPRCATVGDLARLLEWSYASHDDASRSDRVYRALVKIVGKQAGVTPFSIQPHTQFVQDLGMD